MTGTVDADGLLKATGNVDLKNAATLGGDVIAVGGNIDFRDTVSADGSAAQTFDAGTGTLTAATISKAAGNLTLGGDTGIDLDGNVDVYGGNLTLQDNTTVAPDKTLKASVNVILADGKTLTGASSLTIEAKNGEIQAAGAGSTISVSGSSLTLKQAVDLDLANFTFGNQSSTDLTAQSYTGSFTADNTVAANAADKWQSITATAESGIVLGGSGDITTNALTSRSGNISVQSSSGAVVVNDTITTQDDGGVALMAAGDITVQAVTTNENENPVLSITNANIELQSTGGSLEINDSLTANGGGVKLVADDGKIYTPDGANDTLNVAITGYSDDGAATPIGVDLLLGSGQKAAIVVSSDEELKLGQNAVMTAKGNYYTSDDRESVNFKHEGPDSGDPIDVAIYLRNTNVSEHVEGNKDSDIKLGSEVVSIDIVAGIGIGTLVVDTYDTVTFTPAFEDSLKTGASNVKRIEVVSRYSETIGMAREGGVLRLPHADNPDNLADGKFILSGGVYALRGTPDGMMFSLAQILKLTQPVPLVVPMPLEPEVRGEVEEPDIEALLALLVQLGVGEQPELARAYPESLNTDLRLYKAAERLIRLAAVLQSPERVAALDAIVVEVWQSVDVPLTAEQTAVLAQRIEDSAVARPWLAALTDFVDIMTTMVGRSYEDSTASVMSTYVIPRIEAGVLHEQTAAFVGTRLESLGG